MKKIVCLTLILAIILTLFGYVLSENDKYADYYEYQASYEKAVDEYIEQRLILFSELSAVLYSTQSLSSNITSHLKTLNNNTYDIVLDIVACDIVSSIKYWEALMGGSDNIQDISSVLIDEYDRQIGELKNLKRKITQQMTNAFSDGSLSFLEYKEILNSILGYDEIIGNTTMYLLKNSNNE